MNLSRPLKKRNYWTVVVVFVLASLFVTRIHFSKEKRYSNTHLDNFPFEIGEWEGEDIEVDKYVTDILGTTDVLLRRYRNKEGDSLIFTIVYSGSHRSSFHPPEYCYIGGGAHLADKGKEKIYIKEGEHLMTNKLILKYQKGMIKAWYWYSAGSDFTDNYYLQQMYFIGNVLKGKNKGGALIRVSTEKIENNSEEKAKEFIKMALPFLRKAL